MSGATTAARGGVPVHCVDVRQTFAADGEIVHALAGVDLAVEAGHRVALFGPSGSGKSTLLALLAGLRRPSAGSVRVGDIDVGGLTERQLLRLRRSEIGIVVQNPGRTLLPYGTVEDNVRFAQRAVERERRRLLPVPTDLLTELGLAPLARQRVAGLSGGEQQRASVAVALASAPRLLLADEPTSQLDTRSRDQVVELLVSAGELLGATQVIVTHDSVVADACGRRVTLSEGRVVEDAR